MNPLSWLQTDRGLDWPRILLVALVVVTVVAVGAASAVSMGPFSPYGATWEGTGELRTAIDDDPDRDLAVLTGVDDYDGLDATDTAVFLFAPTDGYSEAEVATIAAFLEAGGTLVVLDNQGVAANELLAGLGAEARVDGQVLQDDRHHLDGPLMPVATEVANHSRVDGVSQVALNHASALEVGNATVLVATSHYAHLGEADDEIDDDTELTSYPVASTEASGDGDLVVVADPSVAIDAMYGEADNRAFLDGLVGDAGVVAFDASKGTDVPPTRLALLWLGERPLAQAALGLGFIALIAAVGHGVGLRRRGEPEDAGGHRMTPAERRAYLEREYPEWDAERIERVVGAFNRDGRERGGDER